MYQDHDRKHRAILQWIARQAMLERGLLPDFSTDAIAQLVKIEGPARETGDTIRDLRALPWCSIDNDDSEDLDQLTVAQSEPGGATRLLVAIADVDALVAPGTPIDTHAGHNTTSVYTAALIFPMLPERLSTDLTSLDRGEDRMAMVVDALFAHDGTLTESVISRAIVHNHAKLAYNSLAAWLDEEGPMPGAIAPVPGLERSIVLQDLLAQRLRAGRMQRGALDFDTIKAKPVFADDSISDLEEDSGNRAKEIIEEVMIAANGVTAKFLAARDYPSIRRVVRTPKRWGRIVELAAERGARLPEEPDSRALEHFLARERSADPLRFPDLSLTVIKLMGAGEYAVMAPGGFAPGHFGLALRDYAHSTAPNRRYPDLLTQRLVKAALAGQPTPYDADELDQLARHCTAQENAAKKVERQVNKSAAALLLRNRVGERFEGIVTGASDKGTWVRLFHPPIEGRVEQGQKGLDVGDRVRVQLVSTDVERGYIDFARR